MTSGRKWAPQIRWQKTTKSARTASQNREMEGTFSFGQPTVLFTWPYATATTSDVGYDIHPDGDRFLVVQGSGSETFGDTYVVVNWFEELRERMGGN